MGLFDDDDWGPIAEGSGDYARVQQLENHLIIVFPLGYIDHHPTRFTTPGKKSDVIVCDVIDLDDIDEHGNSGKIYRTAWWRSAQLIMHLRPMIGRRILGRIGKGIPRNGMNPPWVINDASADPAALERARGWGQAHSSFVLSTFTPPAVVAPSASPQYGPPPQQEQYRQPAQQQYQDQGYGQQQYAPAQTHQQQYQQPQYAPAQQQYAPAQAHQQQGQPNYAPPQPSQQGYPQAPQQNGYGQPPSYPVQQSAPSQTDQLDLMRAERMRREAPPQPSNQWQNEEPPF